MLAAEMVAESVLATADANAALPASNLAFMNATPTMLRDVEIVTTACVPVGERVVLVGARFGGCEVGRAQALIEFHGRKRCERCEWCTEGQG